MIFGFWVLMLVCVDFGFLVAGRKFGVGISQNSGGN